MKRLPPFLMVLLLPVAILCWQGCQKNPKIDGTVTLPIPIKEIVTASIQGRVLNEKKEPVSAALIKVSGISLTTTDINGSFRINNIQLEKNAGFVQVEKPAYFTGSRTFW